MQVSTGRAVWAEANLGSAKALGRPGETARRPVWTVRAPRAVGGRSRSCMVLRPGRAHDGRERGHLVERGGHQSLGGSVPGAVLGVLGS